MSVQITKQPAAISFSRNPVVFQFKTDAQLKSAGTFYIGRIFSTAVPNGDFSFVLTYGDITLNMQATADPDDSGYQVRAKWAGATDQAYYERLAADLRSNFYLGRDFSFQVTTGYYGTCVEMRSLKAGTQYNADLSLNGYLNLEYVFGGSPDVFNPNFKLYYELWTLSVTGGQPQKCNDAYLEVDAAGIANIDVSGFLTDAMLADGYDRPEVTSAIALVNTRSVRKYYLKYAEVYGETQVIRKFKQTDTLYTMLGGISNEMLPTFAFPGNFMAGPLLNFMKQEPAEKYILPEQAEYLTAVLFDAGLLAVQLKFTLYFDDDSTATVYKHAVGDQPRYAKLTFPVGFVQNNLNLVSLDKPVVKYTAQLVWGNNEVISETRTYWLDYNYYPNTRQFIYLSSFGTYDTLVTFGRGSNQYDLVQSQAEINTDKGFILANGETINYSVTLNHTETVASGYISKAGVRLFKDLALSLDMLLYRKKRLYAVAFSTKTVKEFKDAENLHAISFDFGYRYNEELFTVDDQDDLDTPLFMPRGFVGAPEQVQLPDGSLDYRYYIKSETYNKAEVDGLVNEAKGQASAVAADLLKVKQDLELEIAGRALANHTHDDRYMPIAEFSGLLEQVQEVLNEGIDYTKVTARSDFDMLVGALVPHPAYGAPTATASTEATLIGEIGTPINNFAVNLAFAQRDAGQASGYQVKKNGDVVAIGNFYTDSIVLAAGAVAYQGVVFFYDGPVKQNLIGINDPAGRILAGNVQSNVLSFIGYYNTWFGPAAAVPANSASARALAGKQLASASNTFILNSGTTQTILIIITAPGKTLSSVIDIDSLNANITSEYILQGAFAMNDAGGNAIAGCKLYVKTMGVAYTSSKRHQITLV